MKCPICGRDHVVCKTEGRGKCSCGGKLTYCRAEPDVNIRASMTCDDCGFDHTDDSCFDEPEWNGDEE